MGRTPGRQSYQRSRRACGGRVSGRTSRLGAQWLPDRDGTTGSWPINGLSPPGRLPVTLPGLLRTPPAPRVSLPRFTGRQSAMLGDDGVRPGMTEPTPGVRPGAVLTPAPPAAPPGLAGAGVPGSRPPGSLRVPKAPGDAGRVSGALSSSRLAGESGRTTGPGTRGSALRASLRYHEGVFGRCGTAALFGGAAGAGLFQPGFAGRAGWEGGVHAGAAGRAG